MRGRLVWLLKWGGLGIAVGAPLGMLAASLNGDPVSPWIVPLAVGLLMLGAGWYAEARHQEPRRSTGRRASIPGYDSHVVDVRESPNYRGHNVVDLQLYTPGDKPSERAVTCRVIHGGSVWNLRDTFPRWWRPRDPEEGERERYHAFLMPACFEGVPEKLADGVYEVVWSEEYGLGWRQLTKPHRFKIRQGLVVIPGERFALVKKLRDLGK